MGEEENDGILNLAGIKRQKRLFFFNRECLTKD